MNIRRHLHRTKTIATKESVNVNPAGTTSRPSRRLATRLGLLTTLITTAFLLLPAGPAVAESPWWHLTSGSRPSYLQPGLAQSEVQQLTVSGSIGEEFALSKLSVNELNEKGFFGPPPAKEPRFVTFPVGVAANAIQAGLEAPELYGPGNIKVSETTANTYRIEFVGELADQPVSPISAEASEFFGSVQATITDLAKGRPDGEIYVTAENLGTQTLSGANLPVTLSDELPPGLKATFIEGTKSFHEGEFRSREALACSLKSLSCTLGPALAPFEYLPPYDVIEMRIAVNLEPGAATGELNTASVSGGEGFICKQVAPGTGAFSGSGCVPTPKAAGNSFERLPAGTVPPATLQRPITVSSAPVPPGVDFYSIENEEEGGAPATQAGSHPFQSTTTITLNQTADATAGAKSPLLKPHVNPVALSKDVHFKWPPGLIGNPTRVAQCTDSQFFTATDNVTANLCSPQSVVGVATVTVNEPAFVGVGVIPVPLFNLVPHYGEPARFGFNVIYGNAPVVIDTALRSDGDYGVTVQTNNILQSAAFISATVSVWGVPGDPRHNRQRGWSCMLESRGYVPEPVAAGGIGPCSGAATNEAQHPPPFLFLPTSCENAPQTSVLGDTWDNPLAVEAFPTLANYSMATLSGCNKVPFSPTIEAEPTSDAATSPTGLNFDINIHDDGLENGKGLVQSQIKKAVVTLPEGFTTNPSVAEGLHACSLAQYQSENVKSTPGTGCPDNSKIGDVEIESPLVPQKVLGSLFVAKQGENPNGNNLLTIYLVAKNPELGVMVKQALKVTPDPKTGQLTTEVDNIPQLPFNHFQLSFRQGQRSPLITPQACGTYTVTADLYPYSQPTIPVHEESSFQITQGPEGLPCPTGATPPFHPLLEAGTQNNAAGTYSPFYTHISRKDSEQEITHFSIKLPPGVIGKLAGVSECSDAQVAQAKAREHEGGGTEEERSPSCPANSEVGHSLVGSGVGNVLAYAPGKLYLAGPYHGSNISLVSITAAKVGPFDLGTVVVRFALKIDPETAEVFVDGQGSDPIPHIVDGIPVHLRDIRAYVDRPDFTLNPTSCAKKSTASTVLGSGLNFASEADDQPVTVTSPFQAADCANLGFAPKLALSLKGGTKRGATPAFKAVLTYPKGSYANIAKSVVTLPHSEFLEQSHIKTICTRAQFKEGKVPGEKCPAASVYGRAEAVTPLLSEPLKGPVYLRSSSHNLPDLVAALHNNQVDFALDGRIDSVRNGRIRNTFETVPDAPVSKFVLEMQGGKKGLLVNSTNLCKGTNRAISEFTGQNGKLHNTNPVLQAKCGGKGKKGKGAKKH